MIRYLLDQNNIKYLYSDSNTEQKFLVEKVKGNIFVDVLGLKNEDWSKLKLYYPNGDIVIGWTGAMQTNRPINLIDTAFLDEPFLPLALFDGRFNS